jgi:hypothetical protein
MNFPSGQACPPSSFANRHFSNHKAAVQREEAQIVVATTIVIQPGFTASISRE